MGSLETKEEKREDNRNRPCWCAVAVSGRDDDIAQIVPEVKKRVPSNFHLVTVSQGARITYLVVEIKSGDLKDNVGRLIRIFTSLHNDFKKKDGKEVCFYIGSAVSEVSEIRRSMNEAKRCADAIFTDVEVPVTTYERLDRGRCEAELGESLDVGRYYRMMLLSAETGRYEELQEQWAQLKKDLKEAKFRDGSLVKAMFLSLGFQVMLDLPLERGNEFAVIGLSRYMEQLDLSREMDQVYLCFEHYVRYIHNRRSLREEGSAAICSQLESIVETHFTDSEFTLNDAAQILFLSPNYLRAVWKRERGITFTEYLTNKRLERAAQLLKSGDFRIQEVAKMVGYRDPRYFSTSFRKKYHMTPGEYQKKEGTAE